MEEEAGRKEVTNGHDDKSIKEEIFTRVVRAGKRTYFQEDGFSAGIVLTHR